MTTIIGDNTLYAITSTTITGPKRWFGTSVYDVVLPANQKITAVYLGWGGTAGFPSATGTVQVGLLDSGNVSVDKPLLTESVINIPYDNAALSAGGIQWISVTGLNIDISAHAGKTLGAALTTPTGSGFNHVLGTPAGVTRGNNVNAGSTTLPNPFTNNSTTPNSGVSFYFVTDNLSGGASITDINTTETVKVGGAVAITASGITSATGMTVGGKSLTSFSGSGTSYTGTMPNFVSGQTYPAYGTQSAVLTDGTNSPSLSVTLQPGTTQLTVTAGTVNSTIGHIGYYAAVQTGDQLTYSSPATLSTATNSIATDTALNTSYGSNQTVYWRNGTTGVVTALSIPPSAVAPTNPLMSVIAENRALLSTVTMTGTKTALLRWPITIGSGNVSSLKISDLNWYLTQSGTTSGPNTFSVVGAAIEDGIVSVPITKTGSRTWDIVSAENDTQSDLITASQFGRSSFTQGLQMWIKIELSFATAGLVMPVSRREVANITGSQVLLLDKANTTIVSGVDAIGTFTTSGTAPTVGTRGYCPLILGYYVSATTPKVFYGTGDSILQDVGDTGYSPVGSGLMQRALYGNGTNIYSGLNFAIGGAPSTVFTTSTSDRVAYWAKYGNVLINEWGTNDFTSSGTGVTAATMLSRVGTIVTKAKSYGTILKTVQTALGIRTTSTDSFATPGNQTYSGSGWAPGSNVEQYNTGLLGLVGSVIDYLVPMNAWRDPTTPTLWKTNGSANSSTTDGIHPNTAYTILLAAELRVGLDAISFIAQVSLNNIKPSIRKLLFSSFNTQIVLVDPDGDTITYSISRAATLGTAAVNSSTGIITYTAGGSFAGYDNFSVTADDGHGNTSIVNVNVGSPSGVIGFGGNTGLLFFTLS